jgi:selenocysteine lyase/cysteine desulfurase
MTFDGARAAAMCADPVDVRAIRRHFVFPEAGRVVTNNAASTQPPAELLELYRSLGPGYENVHRGQSGASQAMTARFEEAYDTIARFIGAPGRECIALYGGDMIAEGRVRPDLVEYNSLPWKYAAGTPNILGTVVSAQALRLLVDLALTPRRPVYFGTGRPLGRPAVAAAMARITAWNQQLTARALDGLSTIPGITIYGPGDPARRTSLAAFNLAGHDPMSVAGALDRAGIEARAGCHCATLAHHALGLDPPASCRLSFYLYNTPAEVDRAVAAVAAIATGRDGHPVPWYRRLRRTGRTPATVAPA